MKLLREIRNCTLCKDYLPYAPKPIVNFSPRSKIIIIGQAPGLKVQKSGIPWDDASGERLRLWMGVNAQDFYDVEKFGIVPMGFCYPGKGKNGDLPPRAECAETFMKRILEELKSRELILLIGQYAQGYFLESRKETLTERVKNYEQFLPKFFVLPHPSPRNNIWLKKNPWFQNKNLRDLKRIVREILC